MDLIECFELLFVTIIRDVWLGAEFSSYTSLGCD